MLFRSVSQSRYAFRRVRASLIAGELFFLKIFSQYFIAKQAVFLDILLTFIAFEYTNKTLIFQIYC